LLSQYSALIKHLVFDRQCGYFIMFTYDKLDDYVTTHISSSYICFVCLFSPNPRTNKLPARFCLDYLLGTDVGEVAAPQRRSWSTPPEFSFRSFLSFVCRMIHCLMLWLTSMC